MAPSSILDTFLITIKKYKIIMNYIFYLNNQICDGVKMTNVALTVKGLLVGQTTIGPAEEDSEDSNKYKNNIKRLFENIPPAGRPMIVIDNHLTDIDCFIHYSEMLKLDKRRPRSTIQMDEVFKFVMFGLEGKVTVVDQMSKDVALGLPRVSAWITNKREQLYTTHLVFEEMLNKCFR